MATNASKTGSAGTSSFVSKPKSKKRARSRKAADPLKDAPVSAHYNKITGTLTIKDKATGKALITKTDAELRESELDSPASRASYVVQMYQRFANGFEMAEVQDEKFAGFKDALREAFKLDPDADPIGAVLNMEPGALIAARKDEAESKKPGISVFDGCSLSDGARRDALKKAQANSQSFRIACGLPATWDNDDNNNDNDKPEPNDIFGQGHVTDYVEKTRAVFAMAGIDLVFRDMTGSARRDAVKICVGRDMLVAALEGKTKSPLWMLDYDADLRAHVAETIGGSVKEDPDGGVIVALDARPGDISETGLDWLRHALKISDFDADRAGANVDAELKQGGVDGNGGATFTYLDAAGNPEGEIRWTEAPGGQPVAGIGFYSHIRALEVTDLKDTKGATKHNDEAAEFAEAEAKFLNSVDDVFCDPYSGGLPKFGGVTQESVFEVFGKNEWSARPPGSGSVDWLKFASCPLSNEELPAFRLRKKYDEADREYVRGMDIKDERQKRFKAGEVAAFAECLKAWAASESQGLRVFNAQEKAKAMLKEAEAANRNPDLAWQAFTLNTGIIKGAETARDIFAPKPRDETDAMVAAAMHGLPEDDRERFGLLVEQAPEVMLVRLAGILGYGDALNFAGHPEHGVDLGRTFACLTGRLREQTVAANTILAGGGAA